MKRKVVKPVKLWFWAIKNETKECYELCYWGTRTKRQNESIKKPSPEAFQIRCLVTPIGTKP